MATGGGGGGNRKHFSLWPDNAAERLIPLRGHHCPPALPSGCTPTKSEWRIVQCAWSNVQKLALGHSSRFRVAAQLQSGQSGRGHGVFLVCGGGVCAVVNTSSGVQGCSARKSSANDVEPFRVFAKDDAFFSVDLWTFCVCVCECALVSFTQHCRFLVTYYKSFFCFWTSDPSQKWQTTHETDGDCCVKMPVW